MTRVAEIELIYAVAEDGTIGDAGGMPWRLPSDLKRFKAHTLGAPVVMGRKTHESIGRPLPGRRNIVVTRRPDYAAPGCEVYGDLTRALDAATASAPRVCVIGGAEIYRQAMDRADRLVVTHVDARPGGDTVMPAIDRTVWEPISTETVEPDPIDTAPTTRVVYERIGRP